MKQTKIGRLFKKKIKIKKGLVETKEGLSDISKYTSIQLLPAACNFSELGFDCSKCNDCWVIPCNLVKINNGKETGMLFWSSTRRQNVPGSSRPGQASPYITLIFLNVSVSGKCPLLPQTTGFIRSAAANLVKRHKHKCQLCSCV